MKKDRTLQTKIMFIFTVQYTGVPRFWKMLTFWGKIKRFSKSRDFSRFLSTGVTFFTVVSSLQNGILWIMTEKEPICYTTRNTDLDFLRGRVVVILQLQAEVPNKFISRAVERKSEPGEKQTKKKQKKRFRHFSRALLGQFWFED